MRIAGRTELKSTKLPLTSGLQENHGPQTLSMLL